MVTSVGFRFLPTDEELVDHYLRLKILGGNTSKVDKAISTVDIYSFDPLELPSRSRRESTDLVWYFFGCKKNQHKHNGVVERQSRKTKSGFWKKTGATMDIVRKRGNSEKIGEKRVFVFQYNSKILGGSNSKSDWVMHEYVATQLSPNQMVTYTICKVTFKGEEKDLPSSSSPVGGANEHNQTLIMNNLGGSEGSLFDCLQSQELPNSRQFSGFLDVEKETQIGVAIRRAIDNASTDDWNRFINNDDDEELFTQEDRSDYRPKMSLTGVFIAHSDDDSDSNLISATTSSLQTSSTCDSFGSSNRRIDQVTDLQKSPSSTTKLVSLTQVVNKTLGISIDTSEKKKKSPYDDNAQGSEIGRDQIGKEMIKNKRAGFIHKMIQRFAKKIKLCSSISRT